MQFKISNNKKIESVVRSAFVKMFRERAKHHPDYETSFKHLSDLEIWSNICLAADLPFLHGYYGRHVKDDKICVRTRTVLGLYMPVSCDFDYQGYTIRMNSLRKYGSMGHVGSRNEDAKAFLESANEMGLDCEMVSPHL